MKPDRFELCQWCGEVITLGEPRSPSMLDGKPMHWECGLRMVAGGARHILKLCTCCGGTEEPDPPGMSKREAARFAATVFQWVQELTEVRRRAKEKGPAGPL